MDDISPEPMATLDNYVLHSMLKNGIHRTNLSAFQKQFGIKSSEFKSYYPNKESYILHCAKNYLSYIKRFKKVIKVGNPALINLREFIGQFYHHCKIDFNYFPIYDACKVYAREKIDRDEYEDYTTDEISAYYGQQHEFRRLKFKFEEFITEKIDQLVTDYVTEKTGKRAEDSEMTYKIVESILDELSLKKGEARDFSQTFEYIKDLVRKYDV